ncbi:hypothetical protein FQN60_004989 [Etheostoma spectabile]|uniref:Uncharacterized protein n=1 Tax=Etheostoma spectabile TaxID=54343 RepID=A0A5J5DL68_9PERO|nr:hypothetical protein FQN60_004989 [Etheostoma spectabile]
MKQCSCSMMIICMWGKQERKKGKLQSAKHTMNPPLSQVMTEQSCKMSRCGETCGKTRRLSDFTEALAVTEYALFPLASGEIFCLAGLEMDGESPD